MHYEHNRHCRFKECCCITSLIIGGIIAIGLVMYILVGLPITSKMIKENNQYDKVIAITGSNIAQISSNNLRGLALTVDGQVCILNKDNVKCIADFYRGVAIRYRNARVSGDVIIQHLILTDDSIVYSLLENRISSIMDVCGDYTMMVIDDISYALTTWTSIELNKSDGIQSYQTAAVLGDGELVELGSVHVIQI